MKKVWGWIGQPVRVAVEVNEVVVIALRGVLTPPAWQEVDQLSRYAFELLGGHYSNVSADDWGTAA
jgi:hypothetical protein